MKNLGKKSIRAYLAALFTATVMLPCTQMVRAATVTSLADSGPGTLREALANAQDGDTISFGVSGTITLTNGVLEVSKSVLILGGGPSVLTVDGHNRSRVFLIDRGTTVTIAGLKIAHGVKTHGNGGGIYNDHASLTLSNCVISGNIAATVWTDGGGIYNDGSNGGTATLAIVDSIVSTNTAYGSGGGVCNDGNFGYAIMTVSNSDLSGNTSPYSYNGLVGEGGGIVSYGAAIMTIINSTLRGNETKGVGGAISTGNAAGFVIISNCSIEGNHAEWDGGAIFKYDEGNAPMTIANSTVTGNSGAYAGGAVYNRGDLTITNCALSGNWVMPQQEFGLPRGGCIYNEGRLFISASILSSNSAVFGYGGGIYNVGFYTLEILDYYPNTFGTVQIANSTINNNTATNNLGGAVYNDGKYSAIAKVTIVNSTLTGNGNSTSQGGCAIYNDGSHYGSATFEIGSTILDASPGTANLFNESGSLTDGGAVLSLGYNLISDDWGRWNQPTDLVNTNPKLMAQPHNGFVVFVPSCGSPAIDKGKNFSGSLADQNGFARTIDDPTVVNAPDGDGTDIGAVELQQPCFVAPVVRCKTVVVSADTTCTAFACIDDGSFDPSGGSITLTQSPAGPYPLGTNVVTLTAISSHGLSSSASGLVIVQDTEPPQLACPASVIVDATGPSGAVVNFSPVATDVCSGPPVVVCVPPSGSLFPIGATIVTTTATDLAGNSAVCQFLVTVLGPHEMLERLLAALSAREPRPQPLSATLAAALSSLDRGNIVAAINQVQAFENRVYAQVAPHDPAFAQALLKQAQDITNSLGN